jgi:hypothetical protein
VPPPKTRSGRYRADGIGRHVAARRRRWPWFVLGGFVVVVGIGGIGAVFALQALDVRDDLLAAKDKIAAVTELAANGDTGQLQIVGNEVLALTTHADGIVQGPLWELASAVPVVGVNIAAVRSATEATHILARDAMPPALQLLGSVQLDQLKVAGGGINLEPFREAVSVMPSIRTAFADAQAHVSTIDRAELIPVVGDAIGQLLSVMDQAAPALDLVEKYLPTVLQLAGGDEPRTYIVLFQNNAEIHSTGGNAATSAIVSVDDGKITMREDDEVAAFLFAGLAGDGAYEMPDEALDIYEPDFVTFAQNYTKTPDFPTSAEKFRDLWEKTNGSKIDGVISLDPVVLSYMLRATGPIALDDGSELNADNAVTLLLRDTYERFGGDGLAADAFFADVAGRVFAAVASGDWDPIAMLDQLRLGVGERRIFAWFSRDAEDAVATELHLDGALTADNAAETQVGVFVNNASYSKLEYYLSASVAVRCDAPARQMTTAITVTSTVPGPNLSDYALAFRNPSLGLPRTTMLLDTVYFAPPGSTIVGSDPESGDLPEWDRAGVEKGHEAKSITLEVPMGETVTASFTSTLPDGPLGPLSVRYSPTVGQTPITVDASCDGLFG